MSSSTPTTLPLRTSVSGDARPAIQQRQLETAILHVEASSDLPYPSTSSFGSTPSAPGHSELPEASRQSTGQYELPLVVVAEPHHIFPEYPRIKSWDLQLRLAPMEDLEFVANNIVDLTDETVYKCTTPPNLFLTCALCNSIGHGIEMCTVVNEQGKTPGCPRCNTTTHSYDDCVMKSFDSVEQLAEDIEFLVQKRHGRPPIDSILTWEDLKGYEGTDDVWPQKVEFAKSRRERKGMQDGGEIVFGIDHMYRVALSSDAQKWRFLW